MKTSFYKQISLETRTPMLPLAPQWSCPPAPRDIPRSPHTPPVPPNPWQLKNSDPTWCFSLGTRCRWFYGARLIGSWLSWVCNQLTCSRSLRVVISSSTWARKKKSPTGSKSQRWRISLNSIWLSFSKRRSQIQQPPNLPITPGRHRQLGTRQLLELQSAFPEFVSFLGWLLKTWEKKMQKSSQATRKKKAGYYLRIGFAPPFALNIWNHMKVHWVDMAHHSYPPQAKLSSTWHVNNTFFDHNLWNLNDLLRASRIRQASNRCLGKMINNKNAHTASWWFQPNWKILVKMGIFPKQGWK